ncbi:TPA: hypothetical protein QCP92_000207 [Bacillus cereus]|nr:hypothetical protein [Bacillus cereus]
MFKVNGVVSIFGDNKRREITVDEQGNITGDEMFKFEVLFLMETMQRRGKAIGPIHYVPDGSYISDVIAISLVVDMICEDAEFIGEWPKIGEVEK